MVKNVSGSNLYVCKLTIILNPATAVAHINHIRNNLFVTTSLRLSVFTVYKYENKKMIYLITEQGTVIWSDEHYYEPNEIMICYKYFI